MNKIFIIGNSHTACLKQAWDQLAPAAEPSAVTFFAHRGKKIAELQLEGNALVPRNADLRDALQFTSGGLTEIRPDDADLVVLYGMGLKILQQRDMPYSQQVKDRAVRDLITRSRPFDLLQKVRAVSNVPVVLGHDPLPANLDGSSGPTDAYEALVERMNELVFVEHHARLLQQPLQTLANSHSTLADFSKDSTRLSVGRDNDDERHPQQDIYHMNVAFGRLVVERLLALSPGA